MNAETLLIPKIENGFVLDHIPPGKGLRVLNLMQRFAELDKVVISMGLNYASRKLNKKDLVKLQCESLPSGFLQQLSIAIPGVTVKKIRGNEVKQKLKITPPELVENLLFCPNPNCITNHEPQAATCFHLVRPEPLKFRCNHCERWFELEELQDRIKPI